MENSTEITSRLNRMEKELARWRIGGAVCLLLGVCVAAAPSDDILDVVRAKEFQLIGANGKVAGKLEVIGNGSYLRLNEADGRSSAMITANDQRAGLYLTNDERINSASIEAYAGGGAVGLSRTTGEGRYLTVVEGGKDGCHLRTKSKDGKESILPKD